MSKIIEFIKSIPSRLKGFKKLSAFILGLLTVFFKDTLGLDEESTTKIISFIGVYILGQGISDNGSDRPTNT